MTSNDGPEGKPSDASPPSVPSPKSESSSGVSRRGFVAGAGSAAAVAAASIPKVAKAAGTDPIFRIHPAIGIARLGNADASTFFIGPEAPGYGPLGDAPGTAAPPYKAPDGRVKPQGARFRIYEYGYDEAGLLQPLREVTLDEADIVSIRWTVHLANKKASFYKFNGPAGEATPPSGLRNATVADRRSLEIDFGPRTISGRSLGPLAFTPGTSENPASESCPRNVGGAPVIGYLGELRTDAKGRLIVLGGKGVAAYGAATAPDLPTYANNDGWFDDASDGPVSAIVTVNDGGTHREVAVDASGGAWVLCAPPDFAPGIPGSVSAYDLLLDLAVRSIPIPSNNGLYFQGGPLEKVRLLAADFKSGAPYELPTYVPSFTADIQPILVAAYNLWWIDGLVTAKHNSLIDPSLADPSSSSASLRKKVLGYLRPPLGVEQPTGTRTMPKLLGDDPYTGSQPDAIRHLALTHVQFAMLRRWADGAFTAGDPLPKAAITPAGLDRAALENCVGGAFFPGIEFGWQMRNPSLFVEPFRLNLQAKSGYWGESDVPMGPGHFSRQMALPWHADFNDCRNEGSYGWWPSQRPTEALPSVKAKQRVDWARPTTRWPGNNKESSHADMVAHWYKFGFVLKEGDVYIEKERASQIP